MKNHLVGCSLLLSVLSSGLQAQCLFGNCEEVPLEKSFDWLQRSYLGKIDLSVGGTKGIKARLETDHLILASVTQDHLKYYRELFSDPIAMQRYKEGKPWTEDQINERVSLWVKRWESSRDPFSAFAIFLKTDKKPFIGHIVIGHGKSEGEAQIGLLFKPDYVNQGFSMEAVSAILYGYVPSLIDGGSLLNMASEEVQATPLKSVKAVVRLDNAYSVQALSRSGMNYAGKESYWYDRGIFALDVEEILEIKNQRDDLIKEKADQYHEKS